MLFRKRKQKISIRLDKKILKEIDRRAEEMSDLIGVKNRSKIIEDILRKECRT